MQRTSVAELGTWGGLRFYAERSALIASVLLWLALSVVALAVLKLPVVEGILLALLAVLLHWLGDIAHQFGHAFAARSTGYPMIGLRLWLLLTSSIYPDNEPELPAATHARRALGGAPVNVIIGIVALIIAFLIPSGTGLWWLMLFVFIDNFFALGLGAFMPLGFTDGSTLLRLARSRK